VAVLIVLILVLLPLVVLWALLIVRAFRKEREARGEYETADRELRESVDRLAEWRLAARKAEYPDATTTMSVCGPTRTDVHGLPRFAAYNPRALLPPEVPGAD